MPTTTCEKNYIKPSLFLWLMVFCLLFPAFANAEWKVDLSRRQKAVRQSDVSQGRTTTNSEEPKGIMDMLFDSGDPLQEMVVLNTDKGFVPSTLRLRKGAKYVVHVVNVNDNDKNVSFVLDAFSEHHATYYGKIKSFRLEPKKEGIYSFQCPETSFEGRVVVYAPGNSIRAPASEEGK